MNLASANGTRKGPIFLAQRRRAYIIVVMMAQTDSKSYRIEQVEAALADKDSYGPARGLDSLNQPLYNDKEATRVLRKVDWRLVPVLTVLYTVSFLDKGSIGNAKVAGMTRDLHMTGTQYNIALTVCYVLSLRCTDSHRAWGY